MFVCVFGLVLCSSHTHIYFSPIVKNYFDRYLLPLLLLLLLLLSVTDFYLNMIALPIFFATKTFPCHCLYSCSHCDENSDKSDMDGSIRDDPRLGHHPHIHHPHVHNNGKTTGFASIPQTELHLGHHHPKGRNSRPPDSTMAIPTDYHIMKVLETQPLSLSSKQLHNVSFQSQQQQAQHNQQQQPHQQPHHSPHRNSQSSKSNNGVANAASAAAASSSHGSGGCGGVLPATDDLDVRKSEHPHPHHPNTPSTSVSVGVALGAGNLESCTGAPTTTNSLNNSDEKVRYANTSNGSGHNNQNRGRSQTLCRPTTTANKHSSTKSPNKRKNSCSKDAPNGGSTQYYHTYNPHNPNKSLVHHHGVPECTESYGGWAYGSICDTTHCCNSLPVSSDSDGGGSSCRISNGNKESLGMGRWWFGSKGPLSPQKVQEELSHHMHVSQHHHHQTRFTCDDFGIVGVGAASSIGNNRQPHHIPLESDQLAIVANTCDQLRHHNHHHNVFHGNSDECNNKHPIPKQCSSNHYRAAHLETKYGETNNGNGKNKKRNDIGSSNVIGNGTGPTIVALQTFSVSGRDLACPMPPPPETYYKRNAQMKI